MIIDSLDHVVLTVRDLEATCRFYEGILGMRRVVYGDGGEGDHATPGSADLCFLTRTPIDEVAARLRDHGITVIGGQGVRTGAQ